MKNIFKIYSIVFCLLSLNADAEMNQQTSATLKRTLDGGYFLLSGNILHFRFFEEYNDTDNQLSYKIFQKPSNILQSGSTNPLTVAHGDNRYSLDVSSISVAGYYILEVSNQKNEKWYLRFKK